MYHLTMEVDFAPISRPPLNTRRDLLVFTSWTEYVPHRTEEVIKLAPRRYLLVKSMTMHINSNRLVEPPELFARRQFFDTRPPQAQAEMRVIASTLEAQKDEHEVPGDPRKGSYPLARFGFGSEVQEKILQMFEDVLHCSHVGP